MVPPLLLSFVWLCGCPQADHPAAPGDLGRLEPHPDAQRRDMSPPSALLPDAAGHVMQDQDRAEDPDAAMPPGPFTLRLVPVPWEGDEAGREAREVTAELGPGGKATVEWPPGMWHLVLTLGQDAAYGNAPQGPRWTLEGDRLGGIGRSRDTLVPWGQTESPATLFNSVSEPVAVELDPAQRALTLRRVHTWDATVAPRLDASRRERGLGDLFDHTLTALTLAPPSPAGRTPWGAA